MAYSTLWMEAYCSKCAQVGQAVIIGICAAFFALIARAAAITSGQVAGGLPGSSPAFSKASWLIHMTTVEELKGRAPMSPLFRA